MPATTDNELQSAYGVLSAAGQLHRRQLDPETRLFRPCRSIDILPRHERPRGIGTDVMTANDQADDETSQATQDAAARRRELIARCAASTAGLDGEAAQRYARDIRRSLVLHPRPQASGTALALETGIRLEFLRQAGWLLLFAAVGAGAALAVLNFWIQSIFIVMLGWIARLPLLYGFRTWRDKLRASWSTMLPAAASPIRADSSCLTVGDMSVPWADVRLEAVELGVPWFAASLIISKRSVDQLRLAAGKGSLVLDVRLIRNGRAVIDTICGKLA